MDELISVVVSTYNWPEALDLSLKSLSAQTDSNFEIIVADDGSGCETARVVEEWCRKSPVKVIHSWQEDKGFRLARSRNVAVTRSAGKYLIFMDGDCIVRSDFVAMHRMLAERHSVLAGQRILLAEAFSQECLISGNLAWCESISRLRELARNRAVNRWQSAVSLPLGFFRKARPNRWQLLRGCNWSLHREDFFAVKGQDEAFEGWGYEDSDMAIRLINNGCLIKWAGFTSPCFHLWHKNADRTMSPENLSRLEKVKRMKKIMPNKPMQNCYD